ncbi:hypothetical protein SLEP1_g52177 [Rubroshorea leprosula]|uniref:Uncharacterized protein n=1 Tax=Rubroshorea leprosula TaxID=152421 RepID=A0AAV5M5G1_9ROSI|nr:hypothetical protein SLEP1_g52177 [Rubroshorea leprosula]
MAVKFILRNLQNKKGIRVWPETEIGSKLIMQCST